jgi:hypothetical protein
MIFSENRCTLFRIIPLTLFDGHLFILTPIWRLAQGDAR